LLSESTIRREVRLLLRSTDISGCWLAEPRLLLERIERLNTFPVADYVGKKLAEILRYLSRD
jgi:hypothetical protein